MEVSDINILRGIVNKTLRGRESNISVAEGQTAKVI